MHKLFFIYKNPFSQTTSIKASFELLRKQNERGKRVHEKDDRERSLIMSKGRKPLRLVGEGSVESVA